MTVSLLPRLPAPAAEMHLRRFIESGPAAWRVFDPRDLPRETRFAATGGARATPTQLQELRYVLVELAGRHGFPAPAGRNSLASFDAAGAAVLAEHTLLDSGEALRDDVWNFIGVILAPDIAHWRFGNSRERYIGGIRNTFQRLWVRGRAFDRGVGHPQRWGLLDALTEDAMVQITERPGVSAEPRLARAIAEAWLVTAERLGTPAMEAVTRRAILRLRVRNEVIDLGGLPAPVLQATVESAFGLVSEQALPVRDAG